MEQYKEPITTEEAMGNQGTVEKGGHWRGKPHGNISRAQRSERDKTVFRARGWTSSVGKDTVSEKGAKTLNTRSRCKAMGNEKKNVA